MIDCPQSLLFSSQLLGKCSVDMHANGIIKILQDMEWGDSSDVSWIAHWQAAMLNLFDYHNLAVLLYPSKMFYPVILPLVSMLDAFFKDAAAAQRKLKLFWFAFFWLVTLT